MKTIKEKIEFTELIKKSKFITFLHPISSLENAQELLNNYKKEYQDATHICYSYILDQNTYKYYDDGEPSNSAGLPIFNVLKNKQLVYVLCVVIRYYGGIKLGVGGLSHAYSNGAISALDKAILIEYKKTNEYVIKSEYSTFDNINYYLEKKGIVIIDKQFLEQIYISLNLDESEFKEFKEYFPNIEITLINKFIK